MLCLHSLKSVCQENRKLSLSVTRTHTHTQIQYQTQPACYRGQTCVNAFAAAWPNRLSYKLQNGCLMNEKKKRKKFFLPTF